MRLDLPTVLVQWAAGGLFGGWLTTRQRLVSTGYGWLFRGVFIALGASGAGAGYAGAAGGGLGASVRDASAIGMVVFAAAALTISIARRHLPVGDPGGFPPAFDLLAPIAGVVALLGGASAAGGPYTLSATRLIVGAAFLGLVTDAMLLGHWYLVQPGLSRDPIKQLTHLVMWVWPIEVLVLFVPSGMSSVLTGRIDDGYGGLLGWMWVVSALSTLGLVYAARRALDERDYSAVMAATGLLYLAVLTAFGTDVLARALLAT
jgi:hypothetical protein